MDAPPAETADLAPLRYLLAAAAAANLHLACLTTASCSSLANLFLGQEVSRLAPHSVVAQINDSNKRPASIWPIVHCFDAELASQPAMLRVNRLLEPIRLRAEIGIALGQ